MRSGPCSSSATHRRALGSILGSTFRMVVADPHVVDALKAIATLGRGRREAKNAVVRAARWLMSVCWLPASKASIRSRE